MVNVVLEYITVHDMWIYIKCCVRLETHAKVLEKLSCIALKPKQREAVVAFIKGKDIFCCFTNWVWEEPLLQNFTAGVWRKEEHSDHKSTVIVISPLIALMKDQVDLFTSKGLKAVKAEGCTKET